jgi:hypothetical protein
LTNPFYTGLIVAGNETYPGRHKPMVTQQEYNRGQAILKSRHRPRPRSRSPKFFTYLPPWRFVWRVLTASGQVKDTARRCAMANPVANQISASRILGRVSEWYRRMEQAGLTFDDLQTVIDDPEKRERLVHYWKTGICDLTTSCKRACEIMGKNFLGTEEISRHFGVKFDAKQLVQLATIPFTETTLQACKKTHILVAGYPLSIWDIREDEARRDLFYSREKDVVRNKNKEPQYVSEETVRLRWYLIRKSVAPKSTKKEYMEQVALLKENEEVPQACELVYAIILYYLARSSRLFTKVYARSLSTSTNDYRVEVGRFGPSGLQMGFISAWSAESYVGIAVSRKF